MLFRDKSICQDEIMFDDVTKWKDCNSELKTHYMNYHIQTKSHQRNNKHKNDNNEQSSERTKTDEDDDQDQESDADTRFGFQRTVSDEVPLKNVNVSEARKRLNDAIVANKECERVVANWIEYKVECRKLHDEKELNWDNN